MTAMLILCLICLLLIPGTIIYLFEKRLKTRWHWSVRVLLNICVLYLIIVVIVAIFQRSLLYMPGPGPLKDAAPWTVVQSTTQDGLILSHLIRQPDGDAKPKGLVILFHGNAGTAQDRVVMGNALTNAGYAVLLAEYRGYGGNPGSPSEGGLYADADSVVGLAGKQGFKPAEIVVMGESLGTGVAVNLAAKGGFKGLVLIAPYTNMARVAQRHYPFLPAYLMTLDRYSSEDKIQAIKAPVMIVQGTADEVVPPTMGPKLLDMANEPKQGVFLQGVNHNDVFYVGGADPIIAFLKDLP